MTTKEKHNTFARTMANVGYTNTPLTLEQFTFLHVDLGLSRNYVNSIGMNVATGTCLLDAVYLALGDLYEDTDLLSPETF